MSESRLVPSNDLSEKVFRELEVALGTSQPDVTEIRRQQRQLCIEVGVSFVPQEKPVHGERSTEVVQTRASDRSFLRYVRVHQDLPKGGPQSIARDRFSSGAREEGRVAATHPETLFHNPTALPKPLRHVGSDGHEP